MTYEYSRTPSSKLGNAESEKGSEEEIKEKNWVIRINGKRKVIRKGIWNIL